jgi:hypothetical protein
MFGEQDRFQERSRQPFIVKDLGPQTEWVRYSTPTGRAVPKFGHVLKVLMGNLVAVQVRRRPNYAAEILPCQTDVLVRVHFGVWLATHLSAVGELEVSPPLLERLGRGSVSTVKRRLKHQRRDRPRLPRRGIPETVEE